MKLHEKSFFGRHVVKNRRADRLTERQTGRQTDRQTERQADRKTGRQKERQTDNLLAANTSRNTGIRDCRLD
jgi:hypothetical protein